MKISSILSPSNRQSPSSLPEPEDNQEQRTNSAAQRAITSNHNTLKSSASQRVVQNQIGSQNPTKLQKADDIFVKKVLDDWFEEDNLSEMEDEQSVTTKQVHSPQVANEEQQANLRQKKQPQQAAARPPLWLYLPMLPSEPKQQQEKEARQREEQKILFGNSLEERLMEVRRNKEREISLFGTSLQEKLEEVRQNKEREISLFGTSLMEARLKAQHEVGVSRKENLNLRNMAEDKGTILIEKNLIKER